MESLSARTAFLIPDFVFGSTKWMIIALSQPYNVDNLNHLNGFSYLCDLRSLRFFFSLRSSNRSVFKILTIHLSCNLQILRFYNLVILWSYNFRILQSSNSVFASSLDFMILWSSDFQFAVFVSISIFVSLSCSLLPLGNYFSSHIRYWHSSFLPEYMCSASGFICSPIVVHLR